MAFFVTSRVTVPGVTREEAVGVWKASGPERRMRTMGPGKQNPPARLLSNSELLQMMVNVFGAHYSPFGAVHSAELEMSSEFVVSRRRGEPLHKCDQRLPV